MTEGSDNRGNAWDSDDYVGDHSFVYEYGGDVLELLDPQPGERVLDLGCGTGQLTTRIADSAGEAVGIDGSREMIEEARATHPDLTFRHADAREFAVEEPFDAVFSNAVLHWIDEENQDAVVDRVRGALVPGGRFVAEFGGVGNVETIVAATVAELESRGYEPDHPWYFASVGGYAARLEARGFEVRYARLFDRPTELESGADGLAGWLDMFGDELLAPVPRGERDAVVAAVEDALREELYRPDDETWVADYRRLRFVAVRK